MSAVSASKSRRINPLDRKIPENPKYSHIRSTIDTGSSLTRYIEKVEQLKRDYKIRKGEIFKRMKVTTFVQLVLQIAEYEYQQTSRSEDPPDHHLAAGDRPDTADREVQKIQTNNSMDIPTSAGDRDGAESSRSTLQSVIRGVGEIDVNAPPPPPSQPFVDDTCPYLLLDVRDNDAYHQCHIITAKVYPSAMLARSVNYETKDMLSYKNQPGKIILIYDEDEKIAPKVCTTLIQREYDNIFLLSGGLKVAYRLFPESLITGMPPLSVTEKKEKPKEIEPANKKHFEQSDYDGLEMYLDNALKDNRIGSRLSRQTASRTCSVTTQKSSVSDMSVTERPPFKC
ncbi:centrosomal protein of 41 kDa-like [Gigantopelta aegis]|uniref:centrosomal protein of 41 kDa-like n=1 Tax=Gigantopelta aegis TaxID=1735272 RepID=UPI001B88C1B1|nr:centrosomal protein of 41 kDa-like [Gigantopelta aegis]